MPAKTNFEAMLEAANQEEDNKDRIAELKMVAAEIREAKIALDSTKEEIIYAKEELKQVKEELKVAYLKLDNAKKAFDAAAGSCNNIVGGIAKAIVDAEKATVSVSVKDSDMEKIDGKLTKHLDKVQKITIDATYSQIQEYKNQRHKAHDQYKEWDGIWFGRYSQWFFMLFYTLGFGATVLMIVLAFVNNR